MLCFPLNVEATIIFALLWVLWCGMLDVYFYPSHSYSSLADCWATAIGLGLAESKCPHANMFRLSTRKRTMKETHSYELRTDEVFFVFRSRFEC